jgi:hypothetical protein
MKRLGLLALVLVVLGSPAAAQRDPGPASARTLPELAALRIGKLYAERQIFEQALLKLAAQQDALRAHTQLTRREYDVKNAELQTVIAAAAAESGLTAEDLKAGWVPDPEARRWVKPEPQASP